jgi:hypothetical protein
LLRLKRRVDELERENQELQRPIIIPLAIPYQPYIPAPAYPSYPYKPFEVTC